jgi:AraC-like DNA-binding protein
MACSLLEQTEKANITFLELAVRQEIIEYYWYRLNNFEQAFELYKIQEALLEQVSEADIPEKAFYYVNLGNAYYYFKDYGKAIIYFNKALELDEQDNTRTLHARQHARNGLGLSYRNFDSNLDRSDSCFLAILQNSNPTQFDLYFNEIWTGIAQANLGDNFMLKEDYDQAIPLFTSSLELMIKHVDYAFSTGPSVQLANIYLIKREITRAKHYVDLSQRLYSITSPERDRTLYYQTLSKYYTTLGNITLSMAYMDSTLAEKNKQEKKFNALLLMRVQQRQHLSEQNRKEDQLHAEKIRSNGYKNNLIITFIALLLIGGVLVRYFILYRKKQAAYHELVRKSQEWASVTTIETPDDVDKLLFEQLNELMNTNMIYKDPEVTLESTAKLMGINRNYLSHAINRCANDNFNAFINEFRVKEAIRMMSDGSVKKFSIEGIAIETGFNDRKTFYRAFKKLTGLSPSEFRSNVG